MSAKICQRQSRRFDPFKFILKTHKHNPPPFPSFPPRPKMLLTFKYRYMHRYSTIAVWGSPSQHYTCRHSVFTGKSVPGLWTGQSYPAQLYRQGTRKQGTVPNPDVVGWGRGGGGGGA
jgi:hypothetical protein